MKRIGYAMAVVCALSMMAIVHSTWAEEEAAAAAPTPKKSAWWKEDETRPFWARLLYYLDTRGNNTMTAYYATQRLPLGLEIFGFTNFDSEQDASNRFKMTQFFTELDLTRLFKTPIGGVGLQAEYNDAQGTGNSVARFGIVYLPRLDWIHKGKVFVATPRLGLRIHPVETRGKQMQASAFWTAQLFHPRIVFEGFADYNINFNAGGTENWVVEPQLRWMILKHVGVQYEFRYNQFLSRIGAKAIGHGFGIAAEF